MIRFLKLGAAGEIEAIYTDPGDGLVEVDVPDSYPETARWDPAGQGFVEDVGKHQVRLWDQVKTIRADKYLLAETPFGVAQADGESRVFINGLVTMALIAKAAGAPFAELFKLADNSHTHPLSADEMIAFGASVGQHVKRVFARGEQLFAQIHADDVTVGQLAAIDIEEGWGGPEV